MSTLVSGESFRVLFGKGFGCSSVGVVLALFTALSPDPVELYVSIFQNPPVDFDPQTGITDLAYIAYIASIDDPQDLLNQIAYIAYIAILIAYILGCQHWIAYIAYIEIHARFRRPFPLRLP